ncbi:MAG: 2-oxoglutarate dehydrogenase E1 component, partial [Flavobacteriales bacterium]|nr:2-oxoglutarate dehydrogenase E1 component [Flavobacteriales bacterium]
MDTYSYLSNVDSAWLDDQYRKYQQDPASVEPSWAHFFEGFDLARKRFDDLPAGTSGASAATGDVAHLRKEFKVLELISGYRTRGHFFTHTNPVR